MLQRKSLLFLIAIAAGAAILAVASYQYYNFTTEKITEISEQDIHSNAQIEAHAISNALTSRIADIDHNLALLASVPSVQLGGMGAQQLFDEAQDNTSDLTDGYYWLDANGIIITYSEIGTGKFPDYRGDDLSYRQYFSVPKETHAHYVSTTLDSADDVPRMYLSQPIINSQSGEFAGVVVAAISTKNAGTFMQSQLLSEYRSTTGLTDKSGLILYTSNQSLIGSYYYDDKFQSILPEPVRPQFDALLDRAVAGEFEIEDIRYLGSTTTIAYRPVTVSGEHLWTAYIIYPHTHAADVVFLLEQQRNFSIVVVAAIGVAAMMIAYLVLMHNRRLELTVRQKTSELRQAVDSLARANDQLKEHDRLQHEFINIAAHELRTPIQPILGITEIKENEFNSKDEITISREEMDLLVRNARRLERLSSDILHVTRIEGRSLKLAKERFDLNEKVRNVVDDVRNTLGSSADAKRLAFNVELPEPAIMVDADKPKIYEVISNLLNNAVKFTENGAITVSARTEDGVATVRVKDTGRGIDPEIMPRLFTKFASKSEKGTGLGLFIAKSIVEAHGGRIWGENNPDGRGATFSFMLPVAEPAAGDMMP